MLGKFDLCIMKVGLIAPRELRDRQKFISRPLMGAGHKVYVLKTKPFGMLLFRLIYLLFKGKLDVVIFVEAGAKQLLSCFIIKPFGIPFVLRLGGDRLKDLDSVGNSLLIHKRYISWIKNRLDRWLAKLFLKKTEWAMVVNDALSTRVAEHLKTPHHIFVVPQFSDGVAVTRNYDLKVPIQLLTATNFNYSEKARGVVWLIEHLDSFVRNNKIYLYLRIAGEGMHWESVRDYLFSGIRSPSQMQQRASSCRR